MFQLYDKDLQSLKVSKYPQLYQFNQYYNLWIPQQAQEPVVCYTWIHLYAWIIVAKKLMVYES